MKRHVVEPLLVLTLFFTYVAGALLLCVMGAGVYQRAADAMQSGYDRRTGALYLTEKVRQHDETAGVRVATLAESDALVLTTSVIYLPGISDAFGFTHIRLQEYGVALLLAVLVIPIVECVKAVQRSMHKR